MNIVIVRDLAYRGKDGVRLLFDVSWSFKIFIKKLTMLNWWSGCEIRRHLGQDPNPEKFDEKILNDLEWLYYVRSYHIIHK